METWVRILIIVGAIVLSVLTVITMTLPTKYVRPFLRVGVLMLLGVTCVGVHLLPDLDPYFYRWVLFVAAPMAMTYVVLKRGWARRAKR